MNTKEVGQILKSLGKNPTEGELVELVNYVDKDGTGNESKIRASVCMYVCVCVCMCVCVCVGGCE